MSPVEEWTWAGVGATALGIITLGPLVLLGLALVLVLGAVLVPLYIAYRILLRLVVEVAWGRRGRRVLLVYSRSPVWQEYVESNWLPLLGDHAIVLNWSDRATWGRWRPFAIQVFRLWKPDTNFNPMAILIPRFPPTRHLSFFEAFRDWKWRGGEDTDLLEKEATLFAFASQLSR